MLRISFGLLHQMAKVAPNGHWISRRQLRNCFLQHSAGHSRRLPPASTVSVEQSLARSTPRQTPSTLTDSPLRRVWSLTISRRVGGTICPRLAARRLATPCKPKQSPCQISAKQVCLHFSAGTRPKISPTCTKLVLRWWICLISRSTTFIAIRGTTKQQPVMYRPRDLSFARSVPLQPITAPTKCKPSPGSYIFFEAY